MSSSSNSPSSRFLAASAHLPASAEENVLSIYPSLSQALGHQACRRGYDVLFTKATKLFRYLLAGRADWSWEKRIKKYLHPDLLIIDDFALNALTPAQTEDFYEIVSERHLSSSIVITSNGPPQNWIALFPDP